MLCACRGYVLDSNASSITPIHVEVVTGVGKYLSVVTGNNYTLRAKTVAVHIKDPRFRILDFSHLYPCRLNNKKME